MGSQDGTVKGLGHDVVGLAETHGHEQQLKQLWGSKRMLVGGERTTDEDGRVLDRAAGVTMLLSTRMARCLLRQGSPAGPCGPRILWAEFAAEPVNVVVVVAYVPHYAKTEPCDADDVYRELSTLWSKLPKHSAKILMLDANRRLARAKKGVRGGSSGPWSVYSGSAHRCQGGGKGCSVDAAGGLRWSLSVWTAREGEPEEDRCTGAV